MAQDYYDILQPFEHIVSWLDDNKATLGLRYIAQHDEELIPQWPAVLVQTDRADREYHATQMFLVEFHIILWVFHAEMTVSVQTRSKKDIELATSIRKLLHSDMTLGGHLINGYVSGEFPGVSRRVIGEGITPIVATRLTWQGQNRVPFQAS